MLRGERYDGEPRLGYAVPMRLDRNEVSRHCVFVFLGREVNELSSLFQMGSAVSGSLFAGRELKKAHDFIRKHGLPVPIEENNLHKQIIQLEQYAGSNHFEKAVTKYRLVNRLLLIMSVVALVIAFGVVGLDYVSPDLRVGQQIISFLFDQFMLSMIVLGGIFAIVIILGIIRLVYAIQLNGKALDRAWNSIRAHVKAS